MGWGPETVSSVSHTPTLALCPSSLYFTFGFKGPRSPKRVPGPERIQKPGWMVGVEAA